MLDRMYNSWRPGTHGPPWASPQAEPEACSSSETCSCPGVIHGVVVIRPCGQLPTCMEMVSKTLGQKFTLNLVQLSTLFHPMRAVLGWFFSKATPEMRIWGQILYLGSTLGRSSRRWRRHGPSCSPSIVRWAKEVGDRECQPSSTQTPDWPPEHLGHRFASAFQISRDFSLMVKPNVYNTKGGNSGKRSSSWAMSTGYKTLYNSPVTVQRMHVLSPQSPTPKPSIFFVFYINGVSASERRSDRQGKYSCPSVSLEDWFQNPPRVPKSMDAQESCIKRLA